MVVTTPLGSQSSMDLAAEIRRPEIPGKREQHLRDLLSQHGLDVAATKDIYAVVHEVLAAVFQCMPRDEVDRLLRNVHRTISTPSPTALFRVSGHFTPMSAINEEHASGKTW